MRISGYRAMWLFVMFDLPVKTKRQRKDASDFRKALKEDGFWMLQYSVYARPCPSLENLQVHFARIKKEIPPLGEVRIFQITDKQFERMTVILGNIPKKSEKIPRQLEFF